MRKKLFIVESDIIYGQLVSHGISEENVFYFYDLLSFGPVVDFDNFDSWSDTRERFAKDYFYTYPKNITLKNLYMELECFISTIEREDKIYILFGSDLDEFLKLLFFVKVFLKFNLLNERNIMLSSAKNNTELIKCLMETSSNDILHPLYSYFSSISKKESDSLVSLWGIITSNDARDHMLFVNTDSDQGSVILDYLKNRYPIKGVGVNLIIYTILSSIKKNGPDVVGIISSLMRDEKKSKICYGDMLVRSLIVRYSNVSMSKPLLKLEGDINVLNTMSAELTEHGEEVLEKKDNNVYMDEWVGGILISPSINNCWFYDKLKKKLIFLES